MRKAQHDPVAATHTFSSATSAFQVQLPVLFGFVGRFRPQPTLRVHQRLGGRRYRLFSGHLALSAHGVLCPALAHAYFLPTTVHRVFINGHSGQCKEASLQCLKECAATRKVSCTGRACQRRRWNSFQKLNHCNLGLSLRRNGRAIVIPIERGENDRKVSSPSSRL